MPLSAALLLAQVPDARVTAAFRAALEAQRAGRLDEAAKGYAAVLAQRPDLAEVRVNYGILLNEQRRHEEAATELERALTQKPSLAAANLFLGIARYKLNRIEPARDALEKATAALPQDAQARMWLGLVLLELGRTAEAAMQLDQAATLAPDNADILYHRGRAHLRVSQESYRAMFQRDPQSVRVRQVLAQSYEESGRDEEAIAEYEAAIKLAPTMPGLHESLGSLYWRISKTELAEAAFVRELELDPHSVLTMYKLGAIRFRKGDTKGGLPLLEEAVRQAPNLLDAHYYLGKAQAELGQVEQATVHLMRVVEGDPSGPLTESAHYQLAQIYRRQGRSEEARVALEHYRRLRSESDQARALKLERRMSPPQ